jgi:hypothetical protein
MPIFVTRIQPLEHVFSHLIDNALRHHPTKMGVIEISEIDLVDRYELAIASNRSTNKKFTRSFKPSTLATSKKISAQGWQLSTRSLLPKAARFGGNLNLVMAAFFNLPGSNNPLSVRMSSQSYY